MAESLLAHLYSRIKGSQEDVATVSLQYIIASSDKLNAAFNRLISDALKTDIGTDTQYSCQSVGENSERPDLSGVDKDGKEVILCEMKFYAGLTSNQPNGYLDRLTKEGGKALVFVCPEQRRVSLWSKVKELCRADGKELSGEAGFRVVVNGIAMAVLTWAEIIETLRRTASSAAVEMLPDIAQLDGFCRMMDSSAFIPFSSEDLGPENAIREERHYQVIDRLFDVITANKQLKATTKGLRASAWRGGYSRYLRIYDGAYHIALVYSRSAWMDMSSAETPFWYFVGDNGWKQSGSLKAKLRTIPEYDRAMIDNSIAVALHPLLDAPLDEIAVDMMNQILRFMDTLKD